MYEIKVSIIEKVNSFDGKLDSLEREGAEAEALININDNLRLIANKAKYDVIVEQLKPIMDGYEKLCKIAEKNGVPLMNGLQSRLGGNSLGIMRSVSVFEHYGKIKCTYCDGDRCHSVYPYNDEEDNYTPNGILHIQHNECFHIC
mgnify:CR=1 FL=1